VEYNCSLIKGKWIGLMLVLHLEWLTLFVFPGVGVNFAQSSSNGKQGPIPEEIYPTLLTKKRKETWNKCPPLTLLSQHKLALTARNTLFAL
jgi:hypothetical protein